MNNWHSANTGRMPTPRQQPGSARGTHPASPSMAAQMNALAAQAAAAQQSMLGQSGLSLSLSGANAADEWSSVPWSLTQALQAVIASDSELRGNVQRLKGACEEIRREQKHLTTHAAVQQMTVGTVALQKDLFAFKSSSVAQQSSTDARVAALEVLVGRLSDEVASLRRGSVAEGSRVQGGLDVLEASLSATRRDVQERGAIMASLGDKILMEVDASRAKIDAMEARNKEMERRIYLWEYSTALTRHGGGGGAQQQPLPAAVAAAASISSSGATVAAAHGFAKSSLSSSKAGVQSNPPGTAVYQASAAAAAAAAAAAQQQQLNTHPLADAIEQHRLEQSGVGGGSVDAEAKEGSSESNPPRTFLHLSPTKPSVSFGPSQVLSPASAAAAAAAAHSAAAASSSAVAAPAPGSPRGHGHGHGHGHGQSAQFQRYMADYTTRNLQRDLLEIAETYQSTIRNEVDGLRSQLLQVRRQASEDSSRMLGGLGEVRGGSERAQAEQARAIATMESSLRAQAQDVHARLTRVESVAAQVQAQGTTRAADIERRYSKRTQELLQNIAEVSAKIDALAGGGSGGRASSAPFGSESTAASSSSSSSSSKQSTVERNVMLVHTSLQESVSRQQRQNHTFTQELTRLREGAERDSKTLSGQIVALQAQMKALFADAFAAIDGAAASTSSFPSSSFGGAHANSHYALLPLLAPSAHLGGATGTAILEPRKPPTAAAVVATPRTMTTTQQQRRGVAGRGHRKMFGTPAAAAAAAAATHASSAEETTAAAAPDSQSTQGSNSTSTIEAGSNHESRPASSADFHTAAAAAAVVAAEEKQPFPVAVDFSTPPSGRVGRPTTVLSGHGGSSLGTPRPPPMMMHSSSSSFEGDPASAAAASAAAGFTPSAPATEPPPPRQRPSTTQHPPSQRNGAADPAFTAVSLQQQQRPRTTEAVGGTSVRAVA